MASWKEFSRIIAEAKASKKLDPVGKEDDDIDNDGDSDESDKYLKKRRDSVGAAIAADRKKKVEESKSLDPVGQEDDDIDNDGDKDKTDKYLLNRRKVRSKIIQTKEEVEQIDEFQLPGTGNVMAPKGMSLGFQQKFLGMNVGQRKELPLDRTYTEPDVKRYNSNPNAPSKLEKMPSVGGPLDGRAISVAKPKSAPVASKPQQTQQSTYGNVGSPANVGGNLKFIDDKQKERSNVINNLLNKNSFEPEGDLIDEAKVDKEVPDYERSGVRNKRYDNKTGAYALGGGIQRTRRAEHEERRGVKKEEYVLEDRELRRLAAQERAAEKKAESDFRTKRGDRTNKKKDLKLSTTPAPKSEIDNYVTQTLGKIAYMDKLTKKNKNVVGLVSKEEFEISEARKKVKVDVKKPIGYRIADIGAGKKEYNVKTGTSQTCEEVEYIEERGMSSDEMSSVLKGHKYSKLELLNMSKKSTKEGRHGEASAFYKEFGKNEEVEPVQEALRSREERMSRIMTAAQRKKQELARAKNDELEHKASLVLAGLNKTAKTGEVTKSEPKKSPAPESNRTLKPGQKVDTLAVKAKKAMKEEVSLVDRILADVMSEAFSGTISGGKGRKGLSKTIQSRQVDKLADEGDYERADKLQDVSTVKVKKNKSSSSPTPSPETKKESESEKKPMSRRTATERAARTSAAGRIGAARIQRETERDKRDYREKIRQEKKAEQKGKSEEETKAREEKQQELRTKEKERRAGSAERSAEREYDSKKAKKDRLRKEIGQALSVKGPNVVSSKESDAKAIRSDVQSAGQLIGVVGKLAGVGINRMREKRRESERKKVGQEAREKSLNSESFFNWREEFIFEIDDLSVKNEKKKIIDVSKKKNKIEINPNCSEAAFLAPLLGSIVRGSVAKGVTGSAAQGTLRAKTAEIIGKTSGDMATQAVKDKMERKFKNEPEPLPGQSFMSFVSKLGSGQTTKEEVEIEELKK